MLDAKKEPVATSKCNRASRPGGVLTTPAEYFASSACEQRPRAGSVYIRVARQRLRGLCADGGLAPRRRLRNSPHQLQQPRNHRGHEDDGNEIWSWPKNETRRSATALPKHPPFTSAWSYGNVKPTGVK